MGRDTQTARLFSISSQTTDDAIYSHLQSHTIDVFSHLIVGGPKRARMPAQLPWLNLTYWLVGLHSGEWQHHHTGCLSRSWCKWSGKKKRPSTGRFHQVSLHRHSVVTYCYKFNRSVVWDRFPEHFLSRTIVFPMSAGHVGSGPS